MSLVDHTKSAHDCRGSRRIAYFYDGTIYGGVEIYLQTLLRHLDPTRYSPSIVISAHNLPQCPPRFLDEVKALNVPVLVPSMTARSRSLSFFSDVWGLRDLFQREGIEIVHCQTSNFDGGKRATYGARLAGVKRVLRTEHLPPSANLRPNARLSVRMLDWLTDCIITDSDSNRQEQIELLGRSPRKLYRSYCGIEVERFSPDHDIRAAKKAIGFHPDMPLVGSVGRLAAQKGHTYFIDAAAKVLTVNPNVRFLLVGSGNLEEELRAKVRALGIDDWFTFAGFQAQYIPYMQAMDITVMASIYEGFSLTMLECMAMGKPCVFTDQPSFQEAVGDSGGAILAPVRSSDAIADGILTFLRDPACAARYGQAAARRVRTAFSIERLVSDMMSLYDSLLAESPAREQQSESA